MYKIDTLLVGLDLTEIDETLIDYVIRLSKHPDLEKVVFTNVQKSMELPKEIVEKYPDIIAPKEDQIRRVIEDQIKESPYGSLNCEHRIEIMEGNPTEKMLKMAKEIKADLIVLGKKLDFESSGISSGKIVKLSPCSVFFIPEVMTDLPDSYVVPVDFSEASKIALEQAITLARKNNDVDVSCVHFFEVPSGYHYSGKSYEEFGQVMRENAVKEFDRFIKKIDTKNINIECEFVLDESENVAKQIYKYAIRKNATGIIIGSRGRTAAASIILGSVAEKLMKINTHFPLFIAKEKDHNLSFLEALSKT